MTDVATPPLETVALFEDEQIVSRGVSRSTWLIRKNSAWVRARDLPGARVDHLSAPPGITWRCRIELKVAVGTELMLTRSAPLASRQTPLAHLERGTRTGRRVVRSLHRVARGGVVEPQ